MKTTAYIFGIIEIFMISLKILIVKELPWIIVFLPLEIMGTVIVMIAMFTLSMILTAAYLESTHRLNDIRKR